MSEMMWLITIMNSTSLAWTTNPMKMCFKLLLTSFLMSIYMWEKSNTSWTSMMFLMIFMGGILITLLILSSLSPNEKMNKNKMKSMTILMITMFMMWKMKMNSESINTTEQMKTSMSTTYTMMMWTMMIMSYFMIMMTMISKEDISMRSYQ